MVRLFCSFGKRRGKHPIIRNMARFVKNPRSTSEGRHDVFSVEERSKIMRAIRQHDTKPELSVRRLVHGLGYRYRLHRKDLPGKPDLVFPARRKIIFVHGCFWHRHRRCRLTTTPKTRRVFWKSKFASNVVRDRAVKKWLEAAGWQVLVVWQCELSNRDRLTRTIRAFLSSRSMRSEWGFWMRRLLLTLPCLAVG